jgi:mono/diheme cytochrome c family protein
MWDGARLKPYEESPWGAPVQANRAIPAGTVARGQIWEGDPINTGRVNNRLVTTSPVEVTPQFLERGQERYTVYCTPCHSRLGDGRGMAVQRGFPHPPDYALPRLRQASLGHFYDVITNGYGVMYSYADRIPVSDRWAIANYLRVLQKQRPVVTDDPYEAERIRARELGITEQGRPLGPGVNAYQPRPEGPADSHGAPGGSHGAPQPHGPAVPAPGNAPTHEPDPASGTAPSGSH